MTICPSNKNVYSTPFLSLKAFFTDTYIHEHPEDLESIEVLKHLIALQVQYILILPLLLNLTLDMQYMP